MKSLAILCLLFALACQPQEQTTTLSETEISAVMEATEKYGTAIVGGDYDAIRALMLDNIILMPPQGSAAKGVDAAMESMEAGPSMEGSISPDQVEGSGNMAYVRGNYDLSFMVNDSTKIQDKGKYIEIWKKQEDGTWKVSVDIWNSNIAPEI